ncbi:hypothetical protein DSO57_1019852 [Entomophthora muscae]|uniref:Uncharacterized protein n=1 Tax=Entomophthora muscae TaxID=34485 RepID=A0ACC2SGK0_9FUNG|nr:hypothetical protein DSO57_1019852 [Entomophthora muscae]
MLLPAIKFVVFTLAPTLLLIWSTSQTFGDTSSLLHVVSRANNLISTGENLVRSLTSDDLEFYLPNATPNGACCAFCITAPQLFEIIGNKAFA